MPNEEQFRQYVERLAGDFSFFLHELWISVGLPPPAEHQNQIAKYLQSGPRRRGVRAFRDASKTWVTLAYSLWRLFRDPNERVMIVSKSEKHSKDSLHMARKWIGSVPWLSHLEPDKGKNQRDSAVQFDVGPSSSDRTPSFSAYGVGGQITGARSSVIISDDVETAQNTLTLELRSRLREEIKAEGRKEAEACIRYATDYRLGVEDVAANAKEILAALDAAKKDGGGSFAGFKNTAINQWNKE